MGTDVETVVVGAGVVGLAIGRDLARKGQDVLVLERHGGIGTEVSSHNSEVIHAGLYYPPGSLRARLCVAGREMLYDFARENGVAHRRCGKLLVATEEADLARLNAIAETAAKNGVGDLVALTGAEARALEPEIACVAAYLSPSTGVIDSHGLMQALEGHIAAAGGTIVLNAEVTGLSRTASGDFEIATQSAGAASSLTSRNLVIAGGLGSSRLGKMIGGAGAYRVPETYPAKGHYFALSGKAPFRHLVYPMPQGAWLGIHLTLDIGGQAKFGPDIAWTDTIDYAFQDEDGARRRLFEREVRRYWPGLPEGALEPGYTGVRPKIYREGEPAADFAIHGVADHGIERLVALYGIESPGLTSSLAIADHVAGLLAS
jgi:L-2-hydroxyglutarate oxidase LhgO